MSVMGITTHQFTDAVLRGSVLKTFRETLNTSSPMWKACGFEEISTDKSFEEIVESSGLGLAPRHEQMQNIKTDTIKQGYTKRINVFAYAIQLPVSELAKRTGALKDFIMGSKAVAESLRQTQEHVAADVFGNAFSATVGLHPDGQPLCSTTNKTAKASTFSNSLGATSLSETGIESGVILARKMPGSNGLPMGGGRKVKKLVIQHDNFFTAHRILKSPLQNNSANNAVNALYETESISIVANTFLPSTSNWFLITDAPNGLIMLWLVKEDMRDYGVNQNRTHVYDGYQAFGVDYVNKRQVVGSSV